MEERCAYPRLFTPLRVNGRLFRNRIISLPNKGKPVIYEKGIPTDAFIAYLAEKARGGAAQVTVGDTSVDPERASPRWAPISLKQENYGFLNELSFAIRQHGAIACIELAHSGPHADPNGIRMSPPGRSPYGPDAYRREDGVQVEAMTRADIERTVDKFAEAALAAKQTGFDSVLIHGGHGWLLHSFLSPRTNHRTDEFGGSPENRGRFPRMVAEAVRRAVGPDFLLEYRISAREMLPGGLELADTIPFLASIRDQIDLVNVSGGVDQLAASSIHVQPTLYQPHALHRASARAVRDALHIPVIALGGINTPALAEELLAEGDADFIGMCRPLLADPYLPEKARTGRTSEIAVCCRCMQCVADAGTKKVISCAVNPRLGREGRLDAEYARRPAPKRVLVVGGGIAGITAALTAAKRGHSVTLAEKDDRLGGILRYTDRDELKIDLRRFKDNRIAELAGSGVKVQLGRTMTPADVAAFGADAVILATGSAQRLPDIPGLDLPHALPLLEAFRRPETLGERLLIVGGGLSGCEAAVSFARRGKRVTVVRRGEKPLGSEANRFIAECLRQEFERYGIDYLTGSPCTAVVPGGAILQDGAGERMFPADQVIFAAGMSPRDELYAACFRAADRVTAVGDCVRPRDVQAAVTEAYFAAMDI